MSQKKDTYVSTKPLLSFIEEHNLSQVKAAQYIHVSTSSVSHWIKAEKMPPWVPLALEAYKRRTKRPLFLVSCPSDKRLPVLEILKALGCTAKDISDAI